MKKLAALVLLLPLSAHCSPLPTPAGALLSTNLNAALVRLDRAMNTNAGTVFGSVQPRVAAQICPGGNCGTAPISALPGCATSPENPTLLLGVLGMGGLLLGRGLLGRRRSPIPSVA